MKRAKLPPSPPDHCIRRRMLWNNGVRKEPLPICFCYYVQMINDVITTYVHGWLETRWCRTLTAVPFDPFHMFVVFVEQYIAWNGKQKKKHVSILYLLWTGNMAVENTTLNDAKMKWTRIYGFRGVKKKKPKTSNLLKTRDSFAIVRYTAILLRHWMRVSFCCFPNNYDISVAMKLVGELS